MVGSIPLARIISSTLREVPHFGLCQMVTPLTAISLGLAPSLIGACPDRRTGVHFAGTCRSGLLLLVGDLRRAGRAAARQQHGAVAAGDLRIDPPEDEHAAVERDHLAVVRSAGLRARTDIGPAVR